jgi:hypothetical protein
LHKLFALIVEPRRENRGNISLFVSKCGFYGIVGECEEALVARNEVCLAVNFDNNAVVTV